jgi:hypothetical protein
MSDPVATRNSLHRVAVHVLARRRHEASGRFGLRATPGGFGTPSFGSTDAPEVLRVTGTTLVHEVGSDVRSMPIAGATLTALAAFAGADLAAEFTAGDETPPLGDPDEPLAADEAAAGAVAAWFDLGWRALDAIVATASAPSAIQLWPEHFDAACTVAVGPGPDDRANIGASPGDGFSPEPYLYVGPWGDDRPGEPGFWNAPFGASLGRSHVVSSGVDGVGEASAFLRRGIERLRLKS